MWESFYRPSMWDRKIIHYVLHLLWESGGHAGLQSSLSENRHISSGEKASFGKLIPRNRDSQVWQPVPSREAPGRGGGRKGTSRAVLSHKAMEFSCCPFQGTEGQIMRQRDQSQGSDGARD